MEKIDLICRYPMKTMNFDNCFVISGIDVKYLDDVLKYVNTCKRIKEFTLSDTKLIDRMEISKKYNKLVESFDPPFISQSIRDRDLIMRIDSFSNNN